jgi:hypothetical protein
MEEDYLSIEENDLPEHFVTSVRLGRDLECFRVTRFSNTINLKVKNSFYDKI